eukprot:400380_1
MLYRLNEEIEHKEIQDESLDELYKNKYNIDKIYKSIHIDTKLRRLNEIAKLKQDLNNVLIDSIDNNTIINIETPNDENNSTNSVINTCINNNKSEINNLNGTSSNQSNYTHYIETINNNQICDFNKTKSIDKFDTESISTNASVRDTHKSYDPDIVYNIFNKVRKLTQIEAANRIRSFGHGNSVLCGALNDVNYNSIAGASGALNRGNYLGGASNRGNYLAGPVNRGNYLGGASNRGNYLAGPVNRGNYLG